MHNNFLLYFTNVQLVNGYTEKNYTFVSHEILGQNIINQSFQDCEQLGMTLMVNKPICHSIDYTKDSTFYNLCTTLFQETNYVKYKGFMPLDAPINEISFTKNVLFKNNAYNIDQDNSLEVFLKNHNILRSYYYKQVSFKINCINSEFSYEYGNRNFVTQYETDRITSFTIDGLVTKRHSGSVYSNKVREFISSIHGFDDSSKIINLNYELPDNFQSEKKKSHLVIK